MLTISPQALAAFGEIEDRRFVANVAEFLCEEVKELRSEPFGEVARHVEVLMLRAREYGLASERGVVTFAIAAAYLGSDFDTAFPPAAAVMHADDMTEFEKINWLESWSVELFEQLGS